MSTISRQWVQSKIADALLRLWLYEEIGQSELIGTGSRRAIVNSLSDAATGALVDGQPEAAELEDILVELADLPHHDIARAESTLLRLAGRATSGSFRFTDEDKMQGLERLTETLIHAIRSRPSFEAARPLLLMLRQVTMSAEALAGHDRAIASGKMKRLSLDFEHGYDEAILKMRYQDIRSGRYSQ